MKVNDASGRAPDPGRTHRGHQGAAARGGQAAVRRGRLRGGPDAGDRRRRRRHAGRAVSPIRRQVGVVRRGVRGGRTRSRHRASCARIAAAEPADQLAAMRIGARLFLAECSSPDVQRIVLIDAPAVLGWDRWREVGMKYGLGVIEAMLAQAIADGVIPDQPTAPDGARAARRARRGRPLRVEGRRRRRGAARDVRGVRPCDQRHRRRPLTRPGSPGTMS